MSISESTLGWRSCHALDGEYRAGNLSYMRDEVTFICYLKSDKETKLPHFPESVPWNNKKWRVLLFLSDDQDCLVASKQYPFNDTRYLEMIVPVLTQMNLLYTTGYYETVAESWDTTWKTRRVESYCLERDDKMWAPIEPYVELGGHLLRAGHLLKTEKGSLNYNDLLHSSNYIPVMVCRKYCGTKRIHIGGETNCLSCKEKPLTHNDSFVCRECEPKMTRETSETVRCDVCCSQVHDAIRVRDSIVSENDVLMCPSCVSRVAAPCESCHTLWFSDRLTWKNGHGTCPICKAAQEMEEQATTTLGDVYLTSTPTMTSLTEEEVAQVFRPMPIPEHVLDSFFNASAIPF